MKKYISLLKTSFQNSIQYKAVLISDLVFDVIIIGANFVFWSGVYGSGQEIQGFNYGEILIYYLLISLLILITNVNAAEWLGEEIKDGTFTKHLLRPARIFVNLFMGTLAEKLYLAIFTIPVYIIVFVLILINTEVEVSADAFLIFLLFSLLSLVLNFFFSLAIGITAFWIDDIWAFTHIKGILIRLLGGQLFPFELLSNSIRNFFEILPFKFMYYIPISYFLENRSLDNLASDLLIYMFWLGIFILISNLLCKKGLKKYGAYGN